MRMTLYLASGTEKAHFFMFCQRQTTEMKASRHLGTWIPKSCCKILEEDEDRAWHWKECRVDIKDWFAKRNDLENRRMHVIRHHVKNPEDFEII